MHKNFLDYSANLFKNPQECVIGPIPCQECGGITKQLMDGATFWCCYKGRDAELERLKRMEKDMLTCKGFTFTGTKADYMLNKVNSGDN